MNIHDMTQAQFRALPHRSELKTDPEPFDSLVILPTRRTHDSDFRCMDFVAVRKDEAICRLAGGSDVLHIDGICGMGEHPWSLKDNMMVPAKSWTIDCLKKSGLLRMFSLMQFKLKADMPLSSFEVYGVSQEPAEEKAPKKDKVLVTEKTRTRTMTLTIKKID